MAVYERKVTMRGCEDIDYDDGSHVYILNTVYTVENAGTPIIELLRCIRNNDTNSEDYRRLRANDEIMGNIRKAFLAKSEVDIESCDYVVVPLDDDDTLWFTQTHFAEIRELLRLEEEVKKAKSKLSAEVSSDDANEKSALSVYAGYVGKTIRRKDGFVGIVTEIITAGKGTYLNVHVTGGKEAGKDTKIQPSIVSCSVRKQREDCRGRVLQ